MRFEEFFDAAIRGDIHRMFLSGGQIDRWGNTNVTAVGTIGEAPKVKLGGGGGGCNLAATIPHLTLWTTRHGSGRTLVEACDFVTDMGHRTPVGTREELGYTGGGPECLVTELGVFDFPEGSARLRQLFPDVTLDQVRAATGFELDVAGDLRSVPLPSSAELAALRAVDPLRVRRQEFSADQLSRIFEHTAGGACAC
jgi:glutaconate CoA-transferase subunit B